MTASGEIVFTACAGVFEWVRVLTCGSNGKVMIYFGWELKTIAHDILPFRAMWSQCAVALVARIVAQMLILVMLILVITVHSQVADFVWDHLV